MQKDSKWKEDIKIEKDLNESKALKLQEKLKENQITEAELSKEELKLVVALYGEQNERLRKKVKEYKKKIATLLKNSSNQ